MKKRVTFKAVTGDPNLVVPGELYIEFDMAGRIVSIQQRETVGAKLKEVLFSEALLQSKSTTYTSNGTKTLIPTSGYKGIKEATINVNVPLEENASLTCEVDSTGGTYNIAPSAGYAGIASGTLTIKVKETT